MSSEITATLERLACRQQKSAFSMHNTLLLNVWSCSRIEPTDQERYDELHYFGIKTLSTTLITPFD